MHRWFFILLISLMAFPFRGGAEEKTAVLPSPEKVLRLKLALRDLYAGHIFWVRNVVFATLLGNNDWLKTSEEMAKSNARALGDAVSPFYGREAADQLFNLFAGHYGAVRAYLMAVKENKAKEKEKAVQDLLKNAEEIATFLSSANPNLPKDAVLSLLKTHGSHHIAQIDDIKAKNFAHEAEVWKAMLNHIYTIADAIADALAKQFPDKI